MAQEARSGFAVHVVAVLLLSSGLFDLFLAQVARMPPDIDVVHVRAMLLQNVSTLELLLAQVARMPQVWYAVHAGAVQL